VADNEEALLRSVATQTAQSILAARQRAEQEMVRAKEELEQKTRELAHSLATVRATLESTWDGILVTDHRGGVTDFNERFVAMWRLPEAIMAAGQHRPILDFIGLQFHGQGSFLARVDDIYAASPEESFDVLELADGRVFERYSRIQFVARQNAGRVWSFRDITASRRSQEALRDESRILELLNRTGSTLSSNLELPALVQAVTDAATELSGARVGAFFHNATDSRQGVSTLGAVSGVPQDAFTRFGPPSGTPLFAPIFRGVGPTRCADVLQGPRPETISPHDGRAAGPPPFRSYLGVPVVSRSGHVLGGLLFGHPEPGVFTERAERLVVGVAAQGAVAIDNARLFETAQQAADERKQLLESERSARSDADRANAMKDEFLATLSHELRTPLTAILGWSHILGTRPPGEAELRHGLEVIERNARVQTQLIDDLLDMSRITSGKMRLDVQPVDPRSFVAAALETVRPAADAKGIRLSAFLNPAVGPIIGDPDRLQQVVWNLLANAIKFTGRDGRVEVRLMRTPSHIEIAVDDTGIGIAPQFLPHVFDRFQQADASHTRGVGSLGLGLSIVKHLVELHGGTTRVASPGEGRGATFTVRLPLAVVDRDAEAGPRRPPGGGGAAPGFKRPDLSGITVLVVEDQDDARDLITRVLTECDAEVLAASTADEALRAVERDRPDVIVSDIAMPDVDGYELLRRVRALGPAHGGRIPAIALTAFARSEDRTRALRAGFLVHVAKPVEPSELVATVASIVGRTGASALE
jgi:signal transduction histidine kinase/ActR/RegA family two-component response regulator